MNELLARDTISGQRAEAMITVNGKVETLFFAKNLEAFFKKEKVQVKTLGNHGTQHKSVGWSGTGTMVVYYISSLFRKIAVDYIKNKKDTYFTIIITNEDDSSSVGKQTTVLYNCNIDSALLAKFDTDSQVLEETLEFTFDGADLLDAFHNPVV